MIEGALSLSDDSGCQLANHLIRFNGNRDVTFQPVKTGNFYGGFYLHRGLPQKPPDLYFKDERNDIVVLLSGSVYNRKELGEFLCKQDTACPEVLARMFLEEGEAFVNKLNGDFAIFIYRPERKQAWLFRDHLGIRPLVWALEGNSLLFSTDAISLSRYLSGGKISQTEFLLGWFKYTDYRKCPGKEVHKLLPGHFLRFTAEGEELIQYWFPEKTKTDKSLTYDRMLSELGFLLNDSVIIRCDRIYNAGAHVSSGIDSAVVASLARSNYWNQDEFYGFSWSPAETADGNLKPDERELVRKTCEMSGIKPVFSDMDSGKFIRLVKSFYHNQGYFEEHRTLEQAVRLKVNLLFSGWGGDEFISAGDRAIEIDLLRSLKFRTFFRRNPVFPLKRFLSNQINFVLFPVLGILGKTVRQSFRDDARHIIHPLKRSDPKAIKNYYFHTSRRQLHLRYLGFYHLQERCESWAVNGFLHGVEYRYPLLDKRIIEYMLKVPSELLAGIDQSRPVIRDLGKGLVPEEVRLNTSKNDPVRSSYYDYLFHGAGKIFMDEADSWRGIPPMQFVDFKRLSEDMARYKHNPQRKDEKILFRSLVYLKAVHSFCGQYGMQTD